MSSPLSISAFTMILKNQLESAHPYVHLQGEVSNFKAQSSGHWYFSLKDQESQISCVIFRLDAQKQKKMAKDGDQIIIKGSLNVYPPSGRYQVVVREMEHVGLGALLLQVEALKQKLNLEGLFSQERKKPLPKFPKTIVVITSPTGAVIQDILNVLKRRVSGFHLILIPTKVQGAGASDEIVEAFQLANAYNLGDIIILARGGGSFEDLFCFNEEKVARAICESRIPVVSAIGHETDFTISDFVADVRAPTPSAAAEIICRETNAELRQLSTLQEQLSQVILSRLREEKSTLSNMMKSPQFHSPYTILGPRIQKLDTLLARLEKENPFVKIPLQKNGLALLRKNLDQGMQNLLFQKKRQLERIKELKTALDPKGLLARGFACIFSKNERKLIKNTKDLANYKEITLLFADGEANAYTSHQA